MSRTELTVLTVPGCPNAAAFEQRLSRALSELAGVDGVPGVAGVTVRRRVVRTEQEAAAAGMHGSPTLLIDGTDPFAGPAPVTGLSCRLYRDEAGHAAGLPPVQALRRVLAAAGPDPAG